MVDFRKTRITDLFSSVYWGSCGKSPVLNSWGHTSLKMSPGPNTPPLSSQRHNNTHFSWGNCGELDNLRNVLWTFSGAQWRPAAQQVSKPHQNTAESSAEGHDQNITETQLPVVVALGSLTSSFIYLFFMRKFHLNFLVLLLCCRAMKFP